MASERRSPKVLQSIPQIDSGYYFMRGVKADQAVGADFNLDFGSGFGFGFNFEVYSDVVVDF